MVPGIEELADKLEPEHGIRIRKMKRRRLRKELDVFAETWNDAWKDNWGFRPYTPPDLDTYAGDLQLVFDKHWFMVAEKVDTGESVGVAITVPDINQVLKKMNGRLLPFGWWHYLRRGSIMTRVRVGFLGVKPEYQHTGVAAGFYIEHFDTAAVRPQNVGRAGLDPREQRRHEPRHGGHGRPARQEVPDLRAHFLTRPWGRRASAAGRSGGREPPAGVLHSPFLAEPADIPPDETAAETVDGEIVAEVRHLPVAANNGVAPGMEIDRPRPVSVPAAAAAATGGFLLGVAAFMLLKVIRRPDTARAVSSAAPACSPSGAG